MSFRLPSSRRGIHPSEITEFQGYLTPVLQELARDPGQPYPVVELTDFVVDYYSICILATASIGAQRKLFFCKCPRASGLLNENFFPLSAEDRVLARAERDSLIRLAEEWKSDSGMVDYVRLLGFCEQANSLILEPINGGDFYQVARTYDLKRWATFSDDSIIPGIVGRIGKTLAGFHGSRSKPLEGEIRLEPKIESYLTNLGRHGVCKRTLSEIERQWQVVRVEGSCFEQVSTLKGIDIRNILVEPGGRAKLIDPGKIKVEPREADLGRFISTLRLLYWGSPWLLMRLTPRVQLEELFLASYAQISSFNAQLLRSYLIKELLKHWCMAYSAIAQKPYSRGVKAALSRVYIDRFFSKELSRACLLQIDDPLRKRVATGSRRFDSTTEPPIY